MKSQDSAVTTTTTTTSSNSTTSSSLDDHHRRRHHSPHHTRSTLARLLTNKVTLQPFIDQFVETMLTNTANLPPVVQHLFEFFDMEAQKHERQLNTTAGTAREVARAWKTNSYFLRYWSALVKRPEQLLLLGDDAKSSHVDASLACVAHTLTDAVVCSSAPNSEHQLHEEEEEATAATSCASSPLYRLLFARELPRYQEMLNAFFAEMQTYQPISDHELHYYLNEFAKCHQQQQQHQQIGATLNHAVSAAAPPCGDVNGMQVLLQLYEYYEKYERQVNTLLGQQQCSILLPVHHRLVQIKDLMMSQSCSNNNATTSHPTMNRAVNLSQLQHQNVGSFNSSQPIYSPYNQYQQPVMASDPKMNSSPYPMHTMSAHSHHQKFF